VEATLRPGSLLAAMTWHKDEIQRLLKEVTQEVDLQQNNVELLDGLNDTIVVTMGMAALAGLPLNEGMDVVNASNLAKINPETGRCDFDAGGKIMKPVGWKKPNLADVIAFGGLYGNRGQMKYEAPKEVSAEVAQRLENCGQFPDNIAHVPQPPSLHGE